MAKFTLALFAALLFSTTAHAATIYSGSFSASNLSLPDPLEPKSISGDWSFTFDETQITGTGDELFSNLELDTLAFSPDLLGTTKFDEDNAFAQLTFVDGTLDQLALYGAPFGDLLAFSQDDFVITYFASEPLSGVVSAGWNVANSANPFSVATGASGSFETSDISTVPLPAAAWLFLSGLVGLGWVGRLKKQTA